MFLSLRLMFCEASVPNILLSTLKITLMQAIFLNLCHYHLAILKENIDTHGKIFRHFYKRLNTPY